MAEREILENAFKRLRQARSIFLPPGHDCAAVKIGGGKLIVATADQLIEAVHYEKGTSPAKIAKKLLLRNLSDIAACGGAGSLFALCAVALGFGQKGRASCGSVDEWFDEFFTALGREAAKWNLSVCGGDIAKIASGAGTVLSMAILGLSSEKKLCSRSGAKDGDILFCTGEFGNSFQSGHHLDFEPRLKEAGFISGKYSRTMIDVSDGLLLDAGHIAEASKRKIVLFPESVPLRKGASLKSALTEGEDYELLFAVPAESGDALLNAWPFRTKLTKIGRFASGKKSGVFDMRGADLAAKYGGGYDHFRSKGRKSKSRKA